MRMPITQTGLTAFLFAELFGFAAFIYLGAKLFPEHETLVLIGPTIILRLIPLPQVNQLLVPDAA